MKCKCGTEFSLESYHDNRKERQNLCHSCYRKLYHPFDIVKTLEDKMGFNIGIMSVAYAKKDDVMMVLEYNFERGLYLLVAGGFYFWSKPSEVKRVSKNAIQYIKQYEAVKIVDHVLAEIQKDIAEYLSQQSKKQIKMDTKLMELSRQLQRYKTEIKFWARTKHVYPNLSSNANHQLHMYRMAYKRKCQEIHDLIPYR